MMVPLFHRLLPAALMTFLLIMPEPAVQGAAQQRPADALASRQEVTTVLARLGETYSRHQNVHARFAQTQSYGRSTRQASGEVWFAMSGMLRIRYGEPSTYLILTDGEDVWVISLEDGKESAQQHVSQSWPAWFGLRPLLRPERLLAEYDFSIPKYPEIGRPGDVVIRLTAKYRSVELSMIELAVDSKDLTVSQLALYSRDGTSSYYVFNDVRFDDPEAQSADFFRRKSSAPVKLPHQADGPQLQPVSWQKAALAPKAPSLLAEGIRQLVVGPLGSIFAMTSSGLIRIRPGWFERKLGSLGSDRLLDAVATPGGLAIATGRGLYWLDDIPDAQEECLYSGGKVMSVVYLPGKLWFLSLAADGTSALGSLDLDAAGRPHGKPTINPSTLRMRALRNGGGGRILYQDLSHTWNFLPQESLAVSAAQSSSRFTFLDSQATGAGLYFLLPGALQRVDDALKPKVVATATGQGTGMLALSRDGESLWIGRTGSIYQFDLQSQRITRGIGLPSSMTPTAIAEDSIGRLWVGTSSGLMVGELDRNRSRMLGIRFSATDLPDHELVARVRPLTSRGREDEPAPDAMGEALFAPLSAGFTQDGKVWLGGPDRLVVSDPSSAQDRERLVYRSPSPVTVAAVGAEAIVAGEGGLFRLSSKGAPEQLLQAAHGSPRILFAASGSERKQLLQSMLRLPAVQDRLVESSSKSQGRIVSEPDQLLPWLESRFGRDGFDSWPWFEHEILALSDDEVLVRTVPTADAEAPLNLLRIRPTGSRPPIATLPNLLPNVPLVSLVQEPATLDWLALTKSGRLFIADRALSVFSEAPLPAGIDARELGSLKIYVGDDPEDEALLVSPSALWVRSQRQWMHSNLGGESRSWSRPILHAVIPTTVPSGHVVLGTEGGRISLSRVDTSGRVVSHLSPSDINLDLQGQNPLSVFLDNAHRLWISDGHSLRYSLPGQLSFHRVSSELTDLRRLGPGDKLVFAESPSGEIFLGGHDRLRMIDRTLRVVTFSAPLRPISALAWSDSPDGQGLWIGSQDSLLLCADCTRGAQSLFRTQSFEHRDRIRQALGVATLGEIYALLADGPDLFVLTQVGLARLSGGRAEQIELKGWPAHVSREGTLLTHLPSGALIVSIGDVEQGSSHLWRRLGRGEPFVPVADVPTRINSLAEESDRTLLLAGEGGRLLRRTADGLIEPGPRILTSGDDDVRGPYQGICPLHGRRALVLDHTLNAAVLSLMDASQPQPRQFELHWLATTVRPFADCVSVSKDEYLLRHADAISLYNATSGEIQSVPISPKPSASILGLERSRSVDPATGKPLVVLASSSALYRYDPANIRFDKLGGVGGTTTPFAVDHDNVWMAADGLQQATLSGKPEKALSFRQWDELDGLPPLEALLVRSVDSKTLLLAHSLGLYQISLDGDHLRWRSLSGVHTADHVQAAALFRVDEQRVMALATTEGVQLGTYPENARDLQSKTGWWTLERGTATTESPTTALAYVPSIHRLLVADSSGLIGYRLEAGPQGLRASEALPLVSGQLLSGGKVVQIVPSADGQRQWLLLEEEHSNQSGRFNYRVLRSERYQVTAESDPLPLSNARHAWLGPSINDAAPRLLVYTADGAYTLWQLSGLTRPRLRAQADLWGISAEVEPRSLDPHDDPAERWQIRFSLDALNPGNAFEHSFNTRFYFRSLFSQERRLVFVHLIAPDGSVYMIPTKAFGYAYFYLRLAALLLLIALGLSYFGVVVFRRIRRYLRLSARFMPYVQNPAIRDATRFFGRRELLSRLRDDISDSNYALVGEFRIGKTSVQHQLTGLLESANHPDYRYFPVFIDLEMLAHRDGGDFFHLLGSALVEMLKSHEVTAAQLAQLRHSQCKDSLAYNTRDFQHDLQAAIDFLKAMTGQRQPLIVLQIDEIGFVEHFRPTLLNNFRGIFQHQPHVRAVVSGHHVPKDENAFRHSPWWNLLREEPIKPFSDEEGRELITQPVKGYFEYDRQALDRLLSYTAGRPQKIQSLCADVLNYKYNALSFKWRIVKITLDDVEKVIRRASNLGNSQEDA